MGRLFAEKETNKSSARPTASKGRLFSTKTPPKPTLGQKVLNTGTKVSTFFGGKALADKIGAKIAKAGATEQEKKFIDEPTNKQVAASVGELGLNIAGLVAGGAGALTKGASLATKVAATAAEGAAYGSSQAALRAVQDQKSNKEVLKDSLTGGAVGLATGAVFGRLFAGKVKKPTIPETLTPEVSNTVETAVKPTLQDTMMGEFGKPAREIVPGTFTQRAPNATEDIKKVMTGLEKAYNKKQVVQIMGILNKNNPTGRYTVDEVTAVASKFKTSKKLPGIVKGDRGARVSTLPEAPVIQEPQYAQRDVQTVEPTPQILTPEQPATQARDIPQNAPVEQTPEYQQSVQQRTEKLDADPEFKGSSNQDKVVKFDELKKQKSIDDLIDLSTGKNPEKIDGLPATAIHKLMSDEAIANPGNFTVKQIKRLSNTNVRSEGGALLQATQVSRGVIDNPVDMITSIESAMREKATKAGTTKNTLLRFLDDIGCTM